MFPIIRIINVMMMNTVKEIFNKKLYNRILFFFSNQCIYVVRKHYENFETIDWLKDLMRNRIRHRNLDVQQRQNWKKRFMLWFDNWSGWICVLLVGVSAGKSSRISNHFDLYLFK